MIKQGDREMLDCAEVLARLYEYLDGELDPRMTEQMHRHIEICRLCYPRFNFERAFLDRLERARIIAPTPADTSALRARVLEALEQTRRDD